MMQPTTTMSLEIGENMDTTDDMGGSTSAELPDEVSEALTKHRQLPEKNPSEYRRCHGQMIEVARKMLRSRDTKEREKGMYTLEILSKFRKDWKMSGFHKATIYDLMAAFGKEHCYSNTQILQFARETVEICVATIKVMDLDSTSQLYYPFGDLKDRAEETINEIEREIEVEEASEEYDDTDEYDDDGFYHESELPHELEKSMQKESESALYRIIKYDTETDFKLVHKVARIASRDPQAVKKFLVEYTNRRKIIDEETLDQKLLEIDQNSSITPAYSAKGEGKGTVLRKRRAVEQGLDSEYTADPKTPTTSPSYPQKRQNFQQMGALAWRPKPQPIVETKSSITDQAGNDEEQL